jgi:bifunctional non-homologous end joining protein LigD
LLKKPKATWVEPVVEAELTYSTLTENNLLREAVFKGVTRGSGIGRRPS